MRFKRYKMGGTVELEGEEAVQLPNGQGGEVEGPDHSEGGVDMNLPEGTMVFSKRLKGPDGKTLAERELIRQRKEKKLKKAIEKQPTDPVNRFSMDRVLQLNDIERQLDMQVQEAEKMVKGYAEGMKYGGKVNAKVKYPFGGILGGFGTDPYSLGSPQDRILGRIASPSITNLSNEVFGSIAPPNFRSSLRNFAKPFVDEALPEPEQPNFGRVLPQQGNPLIQQSVPDFQRYLPTPDTQPNRGTAQEAMLFDAEGIGETKWEKNFFNPSPFNKVKPPAPAPQPEEYQPDPLSPFPFEKETPGADLATKAMGLMPALGPAGLAISTVAPLVTTLLNRIGDKKSVNQFEDYGREALESNSQAMRGAAGVRDMTQRQIDLESNKARSTARNSARGLSTLRALDQGVSAQNMSAKAAAGTQYYNNLQNLFANRAQLQSDRDRNVMSGRKMAFDENEQRRDNFYTNLNKDLGTVGTGMMFGQKMSTQPSIWSAFDGFRVKK